VIGAALIHNESTLNEKMGTLPQESDAEEGQGPNPLKKIASEREVK
jgi:hypothetical protein